MEREVESVGGGAGKDGRRQFSKLLDGDEVEEMKILGAVAFAWLLFRMASHSTESCRVEVGQDTGTPRHGDSPRCNKVCSGVLRSQS